MLPRKIVCDFSAHSGNAARKRYSNFEKIFEIFYHDYVEAFRIYIMLMKFREKIKKILDKLLRKC